MKILNTDCLCHSCIHQWRCKNHKQLIRLQSLLNDSSTDGVTVQFQTFKCKEYKGKDDAKLWRIDFKMLDKIIQNNRKCLCQIDTACLCEKFISTGQCDCGVFIDVNLES